MTGCGNPVMETGEGAEMRQLMNPAVCQEQRMGRRGGEAEDSPVPPPQFCLMTAEKTL